MASAPHRRTHAGLAREEGEEWLPGRDYELGEQIGGGEGEGRNSFVFRIELLRGGGSSRRPTQPAYALKMGAALGRGDV